MMFGDGTQAVRESFFTMADVYFHSGYYPSVFDQNSEEAEGDHFRQPRQK